MLMLSKLGRSYSRATILNYSMNMSVAPTAFPTDISGGGEPGGRPGRVVKVGISIPQELANAVDAELALSPGEDQERLLRRGRAAPADRPVRRSLGRPGGAARRR